MSSLRARFPAVLSRLGRMVMLVALALSMVVTAGGSNASAELASGTVVATDGGGLDSGHIGARAVVPEVADPPTADQMRLMQARRMTGSGSPVLPLAGAATASASGTTITGTITDEVSGQPIAGVCVSVFLDYGDGIGSEIKTDCTAANGVYTLSDLGYHYEPFGLRFTPTATRHVRQWQGQVRVESGQTATIDKTFVLGGSVSGTVTSKDTGAPIEGVCLWLYEVGGGGYSGTWTDTCTDGSGAYTTPGVPPGTYIAQFYPPFGEGAYLEQFFGGTTNWDSATRFQVKVDETAGGIDVQLVRGASVTGKVTAADTGLPVEGVCIYLRDASVGAAGVGCSDKDGIYTTQGLPTGTYAVNSVDMPYDGAYVAPNITETFSLTVGQSVTFDYEVPLGGWVTGAIIDNETQLPVEDACVRLDGAPRYYRGCSDANGVYTIRGVPTGSTYIAVASVFGYALNYFGSATTNPDDASRLSVTAGNGTTGINFSLTPEAPLGNATVTTTCVDGTVRLNGSLTVTEEFSSDDDQFWVFLSTPEYGQTSRTSLQPGQTASLSLDTGLATIPASDAAIVFDSVVDGSDARGSVLVPYKAMDCSQTPPVVSALVPVFVDSCGVVGDSVTLSSVVGVEYLVDGVVRGPGTHYVSGSVVVTAVAKPGFVLEGVSSWSRTFSSFGEFTDVGPSRAFYREICWMASEGISTGWSVSGGREFRPGQPVERGAMAAFLYRFAGSPGFTAPVVSPFKDVSTSHGFYKEITWLAGSGITKGYSDGTFRPSGVINRDAMAAFLYRFAGLPAHTAPGVSPFTDVTPSTPFYKEITWLAGTGISAGYSDGTFRAGSAVNRDAMAAFLHRADSNGIR